MTQVICPRCGDEYRFCPTCNGPCVYDGNSHRYCDRRPDDVLTVVGDYTPDDMMHSVLTHNEKCDALVLDPVETQISRVTVLCACTALLGFIAGVIVGLTL
jgi:hypothetical protein